MSGPDRQVFAPNGYFPNQRQRYESLDIPRFFSQFSEESKYDGGGGGPYGQPTPSHREQNHGAHPGNDYGPALLSQGEYHDRRHAHASRYPNESSGHSMNSRGFSGDSGSYEVAPTPGGYLHGTSPQRIPNTRLPEPVSELYTTGSYRALPGSYDYSSPQTQHWQHSPHAISAPYSLSPSPPYPSHTIPLTPNPDEPVEPLMTVEEHLRQQIGLKPEQPATLWSLPEPLPGVRPPIPLKNLVALAILGSHHGRLTLQGIYQAIEDRFSFFRAQPIEPKSGLKRWQGSIRHSLSLEAMFVNESRPLSEPGKGGYWSLTNERGFGTTRPRKRRDKKRAKDEEEDSESLDDDDSYDGQMEPASGVQRRNSKPSRHSTSPRLPPSSVTGRPLTNSPGPYDSIPIFGQPSLGNMHHLARAQPSTGVTGRTHSLPNIGHQAYDGHRQPNRPATLPIPVEPNYGSTSRRSSEKGRRFD